MKLLLSSLIGLALALSAFAEERTEPLDPAVTWSKDLARFAAEDQERGALQGGVLFAGSSSILMWKLDEAFPDLEIRNRGFGGSQLWEFNALYDRIFAPHRPDHIVIYVGENDLANGATAAEVFAHWERLRDRLLHDLPEARLHFLSFKRAPLRHPVWHLMEEANALIADDATKRDRVEFHDVNTPILNVFGLPDLAFFRDGIHLNDFGYRVWTEKLAPTIAAPRR